jgi:AraC family L-rhamnose operon regulatory protein RhaS
MYQQLLEELKKVTPEEEVILSGHSEIEKDRYMSSSEYVIDAAKLLESGKLIQVRTHTRFTHFPAHTHNYIEVVYMCSGSTHHVINGNDVILKQGELLFLNQKSVQEIYPAEENDIAVNFIILPEFFDYGLRMMDEEKNLLREFIIDCLREENSSASYLHFKVADILPVQNLVENLIWTIRNRLPNKRSINQVTIGLLFLQLMNYLDRLETSADDSSQKLVIDVLRYIENNYKNGELTVLAKELHYDLYWLSKEIKKQTGKNYTELVQEKRLNQATYLLKNTTLGVMDIAMRVGYDNISYFHRIFQKKFGLTPRRYRVMEKETEKVIVTTLGAENKKEL